MVFLPRSPPTNAPSAAALHAFAKHCPKLTHLSASIHTRDVRAQLVKVHNLGHLIPPHPLQTLAKDSQPVASPDADVLDRFIAIFPNPLFLGSNHDTLWSDITALLGERRAQVMRCTINFKILPIVMVFQPLDFPVPPQTSRIGELSIQYLG
ncbi:hypothetical protein B0H13DRAFT_1874046 [Mycena leptocephala]|nr:hypothetical protein B0H13DRAFT_1874046 [Mycena leptocephala]